MIAYEEKLEPGICISVCCGRIPKTISYTAIIDIDSISFPSMAVTKLSQESFNSISMEDIIDKLHVLLNEYLEVKVFMTKTLLKIDNIQYKSEVYELDKFLVDMIKRHPEEAKKSYFSPIELTIVLNKKE
jgi:hypothetical protein